MCRFSAQMRNARRRGKCTKRPLESGKEPLGGEKSRWGGEKSRWRTFHARRRRAVAVNVQVVLVDFLSRVAVVVVVRLPVGGPVAPPAPVLRPPHLARPQTERGGGLACLEKGGFQCFQAGQHPRTLRARFAPPPTPPPLPPPAPAPAPPLAFATARAAARAIFSRAFWATCRALSSRRA